MYKTNETALRLISSSIHERYAEEIKQWEKFYNTFLGVSFDARNEISTFPLQQRGLNSLLLMARGLTPRFLIGTFKAYAKVDSYIPNQSQHIQSERNPLLGAYALWHEGGVEGDLLLRGVSGGLLRDIKFPAMTFEERMVLGLKYSWEHEWERHLDNEGITLCPTSDCRGAVPSVECRNGVVVLNLHHIDHINPRARVRRVSA